MSAALEPYTIRDPSPRPEAPVCLFCGEPEWVEVLEVFPEDRGFMFDACCEALQDCILGEWHLWSRAEGCHFLELADYPLEARSLYVDEWAMRVDYGLERVPVTLTEAKAFVREHHRHNRPPCGWRFGMGVRNGAELVAVVMVGRPVARLLDHTRIVEVNRLCVDPRLHPRLSWNACSMLYGWAAREAKRRGFEKVITYTLETEAGTTLKAAGWIPEATTKGGSWHRPSRARQDTAPTCRKVRWSRTLRKRAGA